VRTIRIVNQSSVVENFREAVEACQKQVLEHFAPSWGGLSCHLIFAAADRDKPVPADCETIYVLDTSDQAGALGYHEVAQGDVPTGFVFAKTSLDAASPWESTLSHELLEQLADPFIQTCAVVQSFRGGPAAVSYEVGDPVEADSYEVGGVQLSNFVLPSWFQDSGKGPFDWLQKLTAPLTLTQGGYVAYTDNLKDWIQYMPSSVRLHRQAPADPFCRRSRRRK